MNEKIGNITLFKSLRECHIFGVRFFVRSASSSGFLAKFSRLINKYLYRFGIGSVINRYNNSFTLYSSKSDKKLYSAYSKNDIFCNFGAGAFFHHKWKNFDYPSQSAYYAPFQGKTNVDYTPIDLCVNNLYIPYQDDSVSLIYCSHTIEHLEPSAAINFLSECYRVLKPNGIIRLAIPSTDNDHKILSLLNTQPLPVETKLSYASQVAKHICSDTETISSKNIYKMMGEAGFKPESFMNTILKNGINNNFDTSKPERHISFWNYEKLCRISKQLKFTACIPFYRGASLAKPFTNLHVFDTTETHISLYLEMVK